MFTVISYRFEKWSCPCSACKNLQFSPCYIALITQASFCSSSESRQLCWTSQGPFNLDHSGWSKGSGAFSVTSYNLVSVVCSQGFLFWQETPRIYVVKEPFSLKFICVSLFLSSWFGSNCHHQFYEILQEINFYFIVVILGRASKWRVKGWTKFV